MIAIACAAVTIPLTGSAAGASRAEKPCAKHSPGVQAGCQHGHGAKHQHRPDSAPTKASAPLSVTGLRTTDRPSTPGW